ncbi:MAG TPA: ATP-binding protein, partial [Flavisolibacter sp.]|nr:ATP-binding protein [Flavisolibacter sp.]
LLFLQVQNLGIPAWSCGYNIFSADKKSSTCIMSSEGQLQEPFVLPLSEHESLLPWYKAIISKKEFFVYGQGGKALVEHYDYMKSLPELKATFKQLEETGLALPTRQFNHLVRFPEGFLLFITYEEVPKSHDIFKRFGKVFQQTYTRFLDLQKAEAQAKEAKIEAALERVRARTMAMYKSENLSAVAEVVFNELEKLELGLLRCGIGIINKENRSADAWITSVTDEGKTVQVSGTESMDLPPLLQGVYNAWLTNSDFSYLLEGEDLVQYYKTSGTGKVRLPDSQLILSAEEITTQYYHIAVFEAGGLFAFSANDFPEEAKMVMKRFADVFNQSYTRFLDLQKAEAQTREAKIEASLEKVRGKAMAMHNSSDLLDVINLLASQFQTLGFKIHSANFNTSYREKDWNLWLYNSGTPVYPEQIHIPYLDHPFFNRTLESIAKGSDFTSLVFTKEEKDGFLDHLYANTIAINAPEERKKNSYSAPGFAWSTVYLKNTALTIANYDAEPYTEEQNKIIRRFGGVFEQTYTRFLDLQKAEAQAKESQIEAALERVRSRTLAMQKSDELAETAAVLFNQLVQLGIEPNRLYIGIIKDNNGQIEFWATDEEGSTVSTQFIADASRNASMKKMYDAWKAEKKSLTIDMQGKELNDYFQYMADELKVPFAKGLSQKRRIQNIAIFGKGFLGTASPDEQPGETMLLLERFAAVFNLTYTRFNDLQIAEAHALQSEKDLIEIKAARKKAEETLTELQSTQKQLIQSEKMASLGELTAGIAHEIQNPLNFVNNFSEVSAELIDEMKEELSKANYEEANEIANDLKQNLEKINHHGKRAGDIVKGMLQHSRASTGAKEPTDINALADEYLRLAYHGLRAKDKTFNATLKTDYDETLGLVKIIPQDMGRVILNLITNAFYAVDEKKKSGSDINQNEIYEPTVSISTKKPGNKIEIKVTDNGNGIPQNIIDKIFQPFFTTKPTGQGTGLGLSLAYDIVKTHGGELKVESKEGEGTEFIIQLPV